MHGPMHVKRQDLLNFPLHCVTSPKTIILNNIGVETLVLLCFIIVLKRHLCEYIVVSWNKCGL